MAAAKRASEERKFVSLLSSRLKKEGYSFDEAELDGLFDNALSNLPVSDLKSGLKKHYGEHLKKLKSILLTKKTQEESVNIQTHSNFNFYKEEEIDRVINRAKTSGSIKERDHLYKILWSCYPLLKDSQKVLSSLEIEGTGNLSMIEKCLHKTVGCINKKSILECLKFLLREFSSQCEACIADSQSSKDLQEMLLRSIVLINHRWQSCIDKSSSMVLSPGESYQDLMAAMLSLYIDLLLISSGDDNGGSSIENLASLMFIVLGHSPEHCMDVLLQVTQPGDKLVQLTRCILARNTGKQTNNQYIKFICLARLALKVASTDTLASVHKAADGQQASSGFVAFLFQSNKSLAKRLGITRKMSLSHVTTHLLGSDISDDDMDTLLDIATVQPDQDATPGDNEDTEMTNEDQTNSNQLFFIDSSGGLDDAEENEVEVEDLKTRDSILHKQMKIINTQNDSESEEEEDILEEMTPLNTIDELTETTENTDKTQEIQESLEAEQTVEKNNEENISIEDSSQDSKEKDEVPAPLRRSTRKRN